jgi:predicted HAD superfamily phosphohydrolase
MKKIAEKKQVNKIRENSDVTAKLMKSLENKIKDLQKNQDPFIDLKNGEMHRKRMSEAVKESWEKIHNIDTRLEKIDERTLVLQEITEMVNNYKNFHIKAKKYVFPFLKYFFIALITFSVIKYFIIDKIDIMYWLKTVVLWFIS